MFLHMHYFNIAQDYYILYYITNQIVEILIFDVQLYFTRSNT